MENNFDIRNLIGRKEELVIENMKELKYLFLASLDSPYYQNHKLLHYQRFDTKAVLAIQTGVCVSVSIVEKDYQQIKEWVESSTKIKEDAKLTYQAPDGITTEVREDEIYWYSIRKSEEFYGVSITKKTII
jgi:hypothetical protein